MSEKIKVLIVEDESIVAMDLAAGLETDGYEVAGIADNAAEAIDLFQKNEVDIILMDVHIIGKKDGIDTAAELLQQRSVPLIYLTAFTDAKTIERAKTTHPAAFLAKPYSITNVRIAIELAISNFAVTAQQSSKVIPMDNQNSVASLTEKETILQMNDYIFVKNNYVFVKIKLDEILYAEADNNYVQLVTTEKKLLLRLSLSQLLEKISYKPLVRIHRSYAVNIDMIQSFSDQEVNLPKMQLPIGRSYKEDFLKQFNFR
ncbi:response regulator [Pseudobacter ginsenosidimutans]|uniref:LytTR family two component transcriptional regulator n=1 Tax=Pseudobacter ginsenosidimutans TaxID=661488 RepID=A0A4Q7N5V6_9BACT|nr:response regulator [Pseudobacter ginsenosidimutans]QEC44951.1 response regulator [Pseudobacter ginsenosidimutans]RZS76444.1 LytTR family two component transcriptional regulator [Pseudobacter ginsenosidimutans]